MPKCPRCQKEVYFGKGFPLPPSRLHPSGYAGLLKPGYTNTAPLRASGPRAPWCSQVPVHPAR